MYLPPPAVPDAALPAAEEVPVPPVRPESKSPPPAPPVRPPFTISKSSSQTNTFIGDSDRLRLPRLVLIVE